MSELTEDDIWFFQKMANGGNSGYLVTTKKGHIGRTYHKDDLIGGKQPVYTEIDGKQVRLLCDPETLTINGYID
jgi:hypothetical protein